MLTKMRVLSQAIGLGLLAGSASFAAHAEVTVLKQDPQAGDPLSRLNFTVGGSIRPQFNNMTAAVMRWGWTGRPILAMHAAV